MSHRMEPETRRQPSERFSVYQFFEDGTYEKVRELVPMAEAVKAFEHYRSSVSARNGWVVRVMVTDGGDCVVAEWLNPAAKKLAESEKA